MILINFLKHLSYECKEGKGMHKRVSPGHLKRIPALTERVDFPGHVLG